MINNCIVSLFHEVIEAINSLQVGIFDEVIKAINSLQVGIFYEAIEAINSLRANDVGPITQPSTTLAIIVVASEVVAPNLVTWLLFSRQKMGQLHMLDPN